MVMAAERLEGTPAHALTAWGAPPSRRHGPLARAAKILPYQLHATLAHPVLGIPPSSSPSWPPSARQAGPRSVTGWLTGPGGRLRPSWPRQPTPAAHHALLDEQPQTPALTTCATCSSRRRPPRRTSTLCGSSPARRDPRRRPAQHAALVRPYATWHVLRRAPARSCGAFTMSAAGWARGRIWSRCLPGLLDDRGTTLGAATQATSIPGSTAPPLSLPAAGLLTWASAAACRQRHRPALPRPSWPGSSPKTAAGSCSAVPARPGHPARRPDRRRNCSLRPVRLSLTRLHRRRHRAARPRHVLRLDAVPVLHPAPARYPCPRPVDAAPRTPATRAPARSSPGGRAARPVAPQTLTRRLRHTGSSPASP